MSSAVTEFYVFQSLIEYLSNTFDQSYGLIVYPDCVDDGLFLLTDLRKILQSSAEYLHSIVVFYVTMAKGR